MALLEEEQDDDKLMEKEIEAFIEKNTLEMEKEMEEIRNSYKEDIQGFLGKWNINHIHRYG